MYDIIIIGAGPAGLSAGLYAGRSELKTLIIEKAVAGGQISSTSKVDNYPGSMENVGGMELSERMKDQAKQFGCEIISQEVIEVDLSGKVKKVKTKKEEFEAKVVIIATGASARKLGAQGEKDFLNRGVSYCATCDAPFYKDMEVYVVGGGEAAIEEAQYLTKFASKVHIIHRRQELRCSRLVENEARANEKIDFMLDTVVKEIKGDVEVNELIVENTITHETKSIKANSEDGGFGVFIFVGNNPQTKLFEGQIELNNSYIKTNEDMKTSTEGVFAVGDVRDKKIRQVVTATADGCIAAINANDYISGKQW